MKQKIKSFGNKILNLMYPKNIKCMFCVDELNHLEYNCTCENCMPTLPFISNPCEKCGSPMNENQHGVCIKCKNRNFFFSQAKSIFEYTDKPLKVVHDVKYNNKKFLIEYMVKYLLDLYATWNVFPDIITCVPLFPTKEKARGYNQSKLMAKIFAEKVNLPFYELTEKVVDTPSQTTLNTLERIENVKNSFSFKDDFKKLIKNKTILIIDDVITTGATTSEISRILCNNGANACYVLSFAHTKLQQLDIETKDN